MLKSVKVHVNICVIKNKAIHLYQQNETNIMNANIAADIITVELFKKMVDSKLEIITSQKFKEEVKYHQDSINKAFAKDFNDIVNFIQSYVDKYYWQYYEVEGFIPFSLADFDFAVEHNKGLLNNCKKILNFAE